MIRALSTTLFSLQHHLFTLLRSKRFLFVLLLTAVAPLLAELISDPNKPMDHLKPISMVLTLSILAPLAGLLMGSSVLSEDVESKTLTYLFTRPVPRWSMFLGRWAASALIVALLLGLTSWWVGYDAASMSQGLDIKARHRVPEGFTMRFVTAAVLSGVLYTTIAAGLSTFLKRAIITGLAYAFVLEMIVGNMPGSTQRLSLQYYLRNILVDGDIKPFSGFGPLQMMELMPPSAAILRLVIALAVLLIGGCYIVQRRQYVLSS
ncbi:MAG: ABC-2 type transport system permease protein [Glaciecola sp.]|jgi:ABC-2 type transport system permease protein